jgi:enoyl-CoA hydratase
MSSTNSKKVMTGEALTLTWPEPDIALVTMIRDREMNTLSLELVHELDVALTLSVDGAARALIITGKGRAFCAALI